MKKITDEQYKEYVHIKSEIDKGRVLMPDTVRFICEAHNFNAEEIGKHFLEVLPKLMEGASLPIYLRDIGEY